MQYHIAENFREVQIFRTPRPIIKIGTVKYKPQKFEHVNFRTCGNCHTRVLCASLARSDYGTVTLFQSGRQHPTLSYRQLSSSVSPTMIKGCGQQLVLNAKFKTAKICFWRGNRISVKIFEPAKISHYMVCDKIVLCQPHVCLLAKMVVC